MIKKIIIKNVSKTFKLGFKKRSTILGRIKELISGGLSRENITVLDDVSFSVESGEIVGLIGSNGAGKTTLLRIIAGIYPIYKGEITTNGNLVSLIGLSIGLNPRLTLTENAFVAGSLLGMSQKEIKQKLISIIKFAELENFEDTKLYKYSTGMKKRFVISLALYTDPEILLADEIFAMGDEHFKNKVEKKIKEMVENGTSVIIVSHRLDIIERYCDRVIWLEKGIIRKKGEGKKIVNEYRQKNAKI